MSQVLRRNTAVTTLFCIVAASGCEALAPQTMSSMAPSAVTASKPAQPSYEPLAAPTEEVPKAAPAARKPSQGKKESTDDIDSDVPVAAARSIPSAVLPAPTAAPTPKLTLANEDATRQRTLKLLDDVGATLMKIDKSKLPGETATTFDQANEFLNAGRKAASEQDYVAASGYADKASALTSKLCRSTSCTESTNQARTQGSK